MILMMEIFLAIALSAIFIYLKREQVKVFIKKITPHIKKLTSYKLFPKIFWGFMLGLLVSYFNWRRDEFFGGFYRIVTNIKILDTTVCIRGLHLVGPLFGVFVGIIIGVSSRPFSVKKLLICILAGFFGGLAYSVQMLPSYIQSIDMFTLSIFSLTFMPLAIGIADKSLFKLVIGLAGEGMGIVFFFVLLILGINLSGGIGLGIGFGSFWGVSTIWAHVIFTVIVIISSIVVLMGIEMSELKDTLND